MEFECDDMYNMVVVFKDALIHLGNRQVLSFLFQQNCPNIKYPEFNITCFK